MESSNILNIAFQDIEFNFKKISEEELTEEQRQEREVKRSTAKYHYNLLQKF